MKVYIKLISIVSVLAILFAGVSVFCASAEETAYIQPEKYSYTPIYIYKQHMSIYDILLALRLS